MSGLTITYLIDTQTLKDNSPILQNVDDKFLAQGIRLAQDLYLRKKLGTKLFNKIVELVGSGTINNNEDYARLYYQYILLFLIAGSVYYSINDLFFRFTNRTISINSNPDGTPVDIENIKYLLSYYKGIAENYAQDLTKYLIENSNVYPEYLDNTDFSDIQPDYSAFTNSSGLFFKKSYYNSDDLSKTL